MTSYDFGDVVLVHFPQSGAAARKQRPGIIVLDIGDSVGRGTGRAPNDA